MNQVIKQVSHVRMARPMATKVIMSALLIVVALGWTACGGRAPAPTANLDRGGSAAPEAPVVSEQPDARAATGGMPAMQDRMIIQRAEISIVITDAQATATAIRNLALGSGGYVASSNLYNDGDQLRGSLTVRVPGQNLPTFMDQVKSMAVRVVRDALSGEDVTQEYTDLNSRLRNLEATETELLALLTEVRQKPGAKTTDILEVYQKLTEIRDQIEQIKGRMQYLSNLTALATIQIELIPDALSKPVIEEGWQPLVTLRNASAQLIKTLQGLVESLIWLVIYVVPTLILGALPFVLAFLVLRAVWRWLRRSRPPAKVTPPPPPPPAAPDQPVS